MVRSTLLAVSFAVMAACSASGGGSAGGVPQANPTALSWLGHPASCVADGSPDGCACSALVPEGGGWEWGETPVSPYWTASVRKDDQLGVWGILGIDRSMEGWYADSYGDLYASPESSIQYLANVVVASLGETALTSWTSEPEPLGDYAWRAFESPAFRGLVVYRLWDLATVGDYVDGQSYIENMYFALTPRADWDSAWESTAGAALSIGCTAEISAQSGLNASSESGTASEDANSILGTEYVHDSNCTNYLVSDSDWVEDGPQGPGYYAMVGGEWELLQPGRCD